MKLGSGEIIQSRYRLLSLKGRGSFGEVWLAKDEQTDMDVAVKFGSGLLRRVPSLCLRR